MSKALTGSTVVVTGSGRFKASVPVARGSGKRKQLTFDTKVEAEQWVRASIAAIRAGGSPLPAPAPRGGRTAVAPSATGPTFTQVAEAWLAEHYVQLRRGQVSREEQVRRYTEVIAAHMREEGLTIETLTRDSTLKLYQRLERKPVDVNADVNTIVPPELDPTMTVTMAEGHAMLAAHGCGISRSTLGRYKRSGVLPLASDAGRQRFTIGDLFKVAASVRSRGSALGPRGGYDRSTLVEVRWAFHSVLKHAALKKFGLQVDPEVFAVELAADVTPKLKPVRALTLRETAAIAGHLHVVHQLVLWLLRCLGLRIAESFGLLVEDIVDFGPGRRGLILVQSQGGKRFRLRNPDQTVRVVDHLDRVKRERPRVLVAPEPLMVLIRLAIDIFHTAPDGTVLLQNRLVPGLKEKNRSGAGTFAAALKQAASREGFDVVTDGTRRTAAQAVGISVTPTPQHLRRSLATSLQASSQTTIENIRAALGHSLGTQVLHLHYLLNDPELKPQHEIATSTTDEIEAHLGGQLMVPTTKRCTTGAQKALATDAARIDALLGDAGWLVAENALEDEGWITVAVAADLRGVTPTQIRTDIAEGRLGAIRKRRADQAGECYLVRAAEVLAMAAAYGSGSGVRALAEELELPYAKVQKYIERHPDLTCEKNGRDLIITDDVAEKVRAYFSEQSALAERALPLTDLVEALGISVASIGTLIKYGHLVEDARLHGGLRTVTKRSWETYLARSLRRRR